ncbi:hypothetical protein EDB85DRAFT_1101530 [Lactarius pseudohatsudake]|nr:hypothetical protein EDB85DRAFT_1101530 [Lactarius pseudohatsudake]
MSPRRKGRCHPHTPNSPRRKRRRVVDEQDQDDSDDSQIEIIVDAPREQQRVPKSKPQSQPSGRPQPRLKPRRSTQQHRTSTPTAIHTSISIHTSTPESTPPPQEQSSSITPPDVNSLAGLPLAILPEPPRTEIAIPPCALSHLHSSPDPPDPLRKLRETQQYAIRQGFAMRGLRLARTVSSQLLPLPNLPPSRTAALVPPPPTLPPQLQPIPMICRMRVWISTLTLISLWTSGMGPCPRVKMKVQKPMQSSSSARPRTPLPHCCAPRAPITIQTGPCSAL